MKKYSFRIGDREYQFKIYDKETIDWLDSKSNVAEFVRNLIHDVRTGKLAKPEESNIKEQIEAEKLKSYKNKNALHNLQSRKLEAETKITEYHANHIDVIGSKPSSQSKEAMNHYVNKTQPYDENAIYCPECTWHSNSKDSINWQIDRITDHIRNTHHRSFTEDEAKIIAELLK